MSRFRRKILKILPFHKYLESTGTQYINTGLTLTKDTGTIEIKFTPTEVTTISDSGNNGYNGIVGENGAPQIGWSNRGWTTGAAHSTTPYMPEIGKTYTVLWGHDTNEHLYIDGQDTGIYRSGTLTIKLFYVESKPNNAKVKMHYCKITDTSGNITHYFVPCYYKQIMGLWDRVDNKFYRNSGKGMFVTDCVIPDAVPILYKCMESTGTQYVDTGLTLTQTTGTLEIAFVPTAITGTVATGSDYNGVVGVNSAPQIGWYNGGWTVGNAGSAKPYVPEVNTIYTATWGYNTNAYLYIDGYTTGISRVGALTVKICSVADGPENCKVKVYYCKITDTNGNVTHYLVPAVYGGITGMYDTVTNRFYENLGTGDFIMSNIDDAKEKEVERIFYDYIESTGTQYINTSLSVTKDTGTVEIKFSPDDIPEVIVASSGTGYTDYNGVIGISKQPQIAWDSAGWDIGNATSTTPYMPEIGTIYTATWGYDTNEHLYIDGQDTGLSRSGTLYTDLFYIEDGPENSKAKIYYCKIFDTNGTLTHYFVPCTQNGNKGMYDTIEKKLYENAGTGDFIMGNKIELT